MVVFSHVDLRDLLWLPCTSKSLRRLVMNKGSMASIWDTAGKRIDGIPPAAVRSVLAAGALDLSNRETHLTGAQWARLHFLKTCYECNKRCPRVDYE